jgi:hypothetical protein
MAGDACLEGKDCVAMETDTVNEWLCCFGKSSCPLLDHTCSGDMLE